MEFFRDKKILPRNLKVFFNGKKLKTIKQLKKVKKINKFKHFQKKI